MQIGILGPLELRDDDGAPIHVAGARLRTLLILLSLDAGRLVPVSRLVDGVWGAEPPAGAANALQALVSRLRRTLPASALIESHPTGYRLLIDPASVDVARFERLVAAARETPGDPATTVAALHDALALALWRGPALLDVATGEFFRAAITRLEEMRLAATEDRVDADLRLGRAGDLVTELSSLVAEHPLRGRLVGVLMRALSTAGRPAEALAVYERTREALADQLGTDPSAELSALHTAVLRGELGAGDDPSGDPDGHGPSAGSRRSNLRSGLTSFVGRRADVAAVRDLVAEYRLVTLTGPGGSGKTRLAGEASRGLIDRMPDGVRMVELAPVGDAADVPSALLAALGLRDAPVLGREPTEDTLGRLVAALRSRDMLLILDNCEHVIEAAAALADRLLGECPHLRVLATSREPLGITGEALWPVGPLALPPSDLGGVDAAEVLSYDAIRLLIDRARAARPGLTFIDDDVQAIARICRALDGIPLAIELAAARLRTMSAEQLAARLGDRFPLLTGGSRTALPRHQTLRAVVDWGWELLAHDERVLLRRLSIFAGGATADAVERVCAGLVDTPGAGGRKRVSDLLAALVDKSFVMATHDGDAPRYRLLETIKAYGTERLDEAGERESVRRAHADYFVALAEEADPHLRRADQLVWLHRLAAEHDNITTALRGAVATGDARTAVRMTAAAGWYWWLGGHRTEGIELGKESLALPGEADDEARATASAVVAYLITIGLGDERAAAEWARTARELSEQLERPGPLLRFIGPLSVVLEGVEFNDRAVFDALELLLADEDPWVRAQARLTRPPILAPALREADVEQALAEFRTLGERWGTSYALTLLAELVARRGDLARAIDHLQEAIAVVIEMGTIDDLVIMRIKLAQLHWLVGDPDASAAEIVRAESDAEHIGWPDGLAVMAHGRADLACWAGDTAMARRQLARAETLMDPVDMHPVFRAMILNSYGFVDAAEGDLDAAGAHRAQALTITLRAKDGEVLTQVLISIADHAMRLHRPTDAVRLLAASTAAGGGPGLSVPYATHVQTTARAALGAEGFAEAERRSALEFDELSELDAAEAAERLRALAGSVLGSATRRR